MIEVMTTAEQILQITKVVQWTLWKIAQVSQGGGLSLEEVVTIQVHAEELLHDREWAARVTGEFVVSSFTDYITDTWSDFEAAITADRWVDEVVLAMIVESKKGASDE